jgi:TolB-like protein/DNA-binding winged helix-turn-helix (wHTH) protein
VARCYHFEDIQIDIEGFRLLKAGQMVPLEPKALNLLIFLVENAGRLVERRELIDTVWGGAFVTDHVLNRAINQLRKALADDAKEPRYIETVPTRGYRFIAHVEAVLPEMAGPAAIPSPSTGSTESSRPAVRQPGLATFSWPMRRIAAAIGLSLFVIGSFATFRIVGGQNSAAAGTPIRSLAVLPLDNLTGDNSQQYLADGMTIELITDLSQIGALRVISQTTAMQYRNAHKSLPEIAKELNVDAVVEGSVMRSKDHVRIGAQLVSAHADKQLWASSYEGDLRDVMELENRVASAVAEQIRVKLTPSEQTRLADARSVNPRASEALLRGDSAIQGSTFEAQRKGLGFFQQAIDLDPQFAPAYVGLARSYNYLAGWTSLPPNIAIPVGEATAAAESAIAKALKINPQLGEAYEERAWTLLKFHWDFPDAEADFRHALTLEPGAPSAHDGLSEVLAASGRFDEAVWEIKRAQELDPLSLVINTDYCRVLQYARQDGRAMAQCNTTVRLGPDDVYALWISAQLFERKGVYAQAHKLWQKLGPCDGRFLAMIDEVNGAPGVSGAFDAWLKKSKYQPDAFFLSMAYANLGRKDLAFASLEKAYEQRSGIFFMAFLAVDPAFDPLRSDPRFDAFLRRAGLPPQPHTVLAQSGSLPASDMKSQ